MLKFQVPGSLLVSGSSGSGKTRWIHDLLKKDHDLRAGGIAGQGLFEKPFDNLILFYQQYQPIYDDIAALFPKAHMSQGVQWEDVDALDGSLQTCLFLDDMMSSLADDMRLSDLFTSGRHRLISPFFLVQNLYVQGKAMKGVHRNVNYLLLFRTPRDARMIAVSNLIHTICRYVVICMCSSCKYCFRLSTSRCSDVQDLTSSTTLTNVRPNDHIIHC